MEVAPSHPLGVGEGAEEGVCLPLKVARLSRETFEQLQQFLPVRGELGRNCCNCSNVSRDNLATFQMAAAFGPLTDAEWMRWGYLHMDHHLRQFSTGGDYRLGASSIKTSTTVICAGRVPISSPSAYISLSGFRARPRCGSTHSVRSFRQRDPRPEPSISRATNRG